MEKRFVILIVSILCRLNIFSQDLCQSGGIKTSSPNRDEFPGMESFEIGFNKGKNHESKFSIPCLYEDTYKDGHGANGNHVRYKVATNKDVNEFTETELRNDDVNIYIIRGDFKARGNHKNENHYTNSVKFQDLELTSSIEWSADKNSWYCADNLVSTKLTPVTSKGDSYNVNYFFAGETCLIEGSEFWDCIMSNQSVKKTYENKGSITIYFRYVFFAKLYYLTNDGGARKTTTGYLRQQDNTWGSITINRCKVEDLKLGSSLPVINEEIQNGYALYEKQASPIVVSSYVARYDKLSVGDMQIEDSEHSIFYRVYNSSNLAGEVSNSIELNLNSVHPGSQLELQRLVYFNNTQEQNIVCKSSNKLNFTVFPEPYLEGFDASETDTVFCQAKTPLEVGKKLNEQDSTVLYARLKGNRCDFKGFEEYSSTYGVVYGWRYWTNRNSSHNLLAIKSKEDNVVSADEIFDYNLDGDGPDLYFPLSALKPGVTYYFEQYVKLKNFENAVVGLLFLRRVA